MYRQRQQLTLLLQNESRSDNYRVLLNVSHAKNLIVYAEVSYWKRRTTILKNVKNLRLKLHPTTDGLPPRMAKIIQTQFRAAKSKIRGVRWTEHDIETGIAYIISCKSPLCSAVKEGIVYVLRSTGIQLQVCLLFLVHLYLLSSS